MRVHSVTWCGAILKILIRGPSAPEAQAGSLGTRSPPSSTTSTG